MCLDTFPSQLVVLKNLNDTCVSFTRIQYTNLLKHTSTFPQQRVHERPLLIDYYSEFLTRLTCQPRMLESSPSCFGSY